MSPFAHLQNDTVFIESPDGTRSEPYRTSLGQKGGMHCATIFVAQLQAQDGWTFVRTLPGNAEERFTILEVNYRSGLHSIPPHWDFRLQKEASLINRTQQKQPQSIHITTAHNVQIGDHNVQHIVDSLKNLIREIESADATPEQKHEARGLLATLLRNPIVASVLGGVASGVFSLPGN